MNETLPTAMHAQQVQQQEIYEDRLTHERNGAIEETGKVERIRDILFGTHMRDYDVRFQRIEQNLAQEAAAVRSDMEQRLDALEKFMKGEMASMASRAHAEHAERLGAMEKIGRELSEATKALDGKITQLDLQIGTQIRTLREQLLDQSKNLGAEIRERHEQMKAGLDHESAQIRDAMTGREALSEMFSEIALRLKDEFRIPGV